MRLWRCISFDSYIKPQLLASTEQVPTVVYLLTPTSNHNCICSLFCYDVLYIFWLLHQTTTLQSPSELKECCISFDSYIKPQRKSDYFYCGHCCISFDSYIKPQPLVIKPQNAVGCISFDSYIKPQLGSLLIMFRSVVYLLTPTSNHNGLYRITPQLDVVYLLTPTSNHNCEKFRYIGNAVVYLLTPTSNHNL